MLDVAVSYTRYKFLGHEFLTWLWFVLEKQPEVLHAADPEATSLEVGNRMVLEKKRNKATETITIKGDQAGLDEGILALKKGAVVTELHLVYKTGEHEWRFNLKGESLNYSALRTPQTGAVEKKEDIEGAVLEKIYLYEKVFALTNQLFRTFARLRVSDRWTTETVPAMRQWIAAA